MTSNKFNDLNIDVKIVKSIGSTNDALRELAESGHSDDCVLISEEQTKGKGRRGRSFYSPSGTGIYVSLLLHPDKDIEEVQNITTIIAVAAAVSIEKITGLDVSIKWVNDLWMRGKKVCGILTETSSVIKDGVPEYVITGIGINIFEPKGGFPDEIKDAAGAVFTDATARDKSIKFDIAAELIRQFMCYYNTEFLHATNMSVSSDKSGKIPSYFDEYKKRLFIIGKDVEILSPDHLSLNKKAHVLGINEKCHLHVKYEDGSEDYLSGGEISIKL